MKTVKNRFGELQTEWTSHKHVNNPDFQQLIKYTHIQYPDGRNNLHWRLWNSSSNDKHVIYNITLQEAQAKFTDESISDISEQEYQEWLSKK